MSIRRGGRAGMAASLCMGLGLACPAPVALAQSAQSFPSKPIRMVIPNAPGGGSDILARLMGGKLTEAWGQPVIADNKAGATGVIAAEFVAKQPPDGHTMVMVTLTQLIGTLVAQKYSFATEFAPVSYMGGSPFAVAVNPSVPVNTFPEFVAYAKANPDKLAYSSSGNWSAFHLCMESINEIIGAKMLHVPFPGSPQANNALIAGQVQATCAGAPPLLGLAKTGKLKILAVTYQKPTRFLPDVPPIANTLPGYEILGWYGLEVTKGTPPEVVNKINGEVGKMVRNQEFFDKALGLGIELQNSTPAEYTAFLRKESDRWGKFLKERNAKLDD